MNKNLGLFKEELTLPLYGEGYRSEERVRAALQRLKKQNFLSDFLKARPKDDKAGIDFWLVVPGEFKYLEMPLQVKSSEYCQIQHKNSHPKIPSVAVGHIKFKSVLKKLKKIISRYKSNVILHL